MGPDHRHSNRRSLTGHTRQVVAVATTWLPDGRVVAITGSYDTTVRIWDLTTGNSIGDPLTGHTCPVVAVATTWLPDGRLVAVTGSYDDR
ncbi:WD40 repeat domain-containing protein [Luedemannella flava]